MAIDDHDSDDSELDEHDESTEIQADPPVAPAPARREVLPWVLFFATLIIFVGLTLFLYQRVNAQTDLAAAAAAEAEKAVAAQKAADANVTPLKDKISTLETQLRATTAERDSLLEKQKAAVSAAAVAEAKSAEPDPKKGPGAKRPGKPAAKKKKK